MLVSLKILIIATLMNKSFIQTSAFIALTSSMAAQANLSQPMSLLPEPVSNNAVTVVENNGKQYIVSFSGLGATKDHHDVHNKTFVYHINTNTWQQGSDVPIQTPIIDVTKSQKKVELTGRLASVATSIGPLAYVFGGYTVAHNHSEVSVPDVYSYDVTKDKYTLLAPMPVPVDDSVALTYQNRYIYLVSGWHNDGNVNLVQLYDIKTDTWTQATPFPGKPVFGQAGAIVNNKLMVCDGVAVEFHHTKRRNYAAEPACYLGTIDSKNVNKIDWRIAKHPTGTARYRMAAKGDENTNQFIFVGGSDNPYNFSGIGYNKVPSTADSSIWQYDIDNNTWTISKSPFETMDHRALLKLNNHYLTVGGMNSQQKVLNTINIHPVTSLK